MIPPRNLFKAVKQEDLKSVKNLIAARHNVNCYDETGRTPLHYAVDCAGIDIAEILCDSGADVNANSIKLPPEDLFAAAKVGDAAVIQNLIAGGHSVNTRDRYGRTPLHYAILCKQQNVSEIIVAEGANVNAVVDFGKTPQQYEHGAFLKQ
eukprot:TRINITY_DN27766_c0_g1_i2.p3 TRINITY_DN27766_c0_g1~~TRINITY_DN27766_c0_g1_i2.p3  ORF type:complete len:151 (-),score=28.54 TRINITY_DN27766_c0_g1_i2:963-1415(-)